MTTQRWEEFGADQACHGNTQPARGSHSVNDTQITNRPTSWQPRPSRLQKHLEPSSGELMPSSGPRLLSLSSEIVSPRSWLGPGSYQLQGSRGDVGALRGALIWKHSETAMGPHTRARLSAQEPVGLSLTNFFHVHSRPLYPQSGEVFREKTDMLQIRKLRSRTAVLSSKSKQQ